MIEFALSTYLQTRPTIEAIVGTRIYAIRAPQTTTQNKTQAKILYELLPGSTRHYHAGGASRMVEADIQLTLVAATYPAARELYEALRNEIDAFRGDWDTTKIKRAFLSPPYWQGVDPTQGDDTGHPSVIADLNVLYEETAPVPVDP